MSDIVEGLGTAVEGGLFAKALTEKAGGDPKLSKGHFAEGACLNCGTQLVGNHCHTCGQKAHLHRTLSAFMHDVAHGAVHFDSKTWRTLPMLAFKPGELTRRYIDGERTRFVSPMALFLFSIFLMFAVFQFSGISAPTDLRGDGGQQAMEFVEDQAERLQARRDILAKRAVDPERTEAEREEDAAELVEIDKQIAALAEARDELPFLKDAAPDSKETAAAEDSPVVITEKESSGQVLTADGWESNLEQVDWLEKGVEKWRTNPGLMIYKLQTNFYKFSWLLIPLSIPFVWLLFVWKRRFRAYDHAIFVTYSLAFMTLLILGLVLLGMGGAPTAMVVIASLAVPPVHIYKHLRGTYGLSRFSALWRLSVLSFLILVILLLFTSLLMLLGLF